MRFLTGQGHVDLYYGDMFALELTLHDLEKIYESCPISAPIDVTSLPHTIPNQRIMFFKTISRLEQKRIPMSLMVRQYSPELVLTETRALQLSPKI